MLLTTKRASVCSRVVNSYTVPSLYTLTSSLNTTEELIKWDAVIVVIYTLCVVEILWKTIISKTCLNTHTTTTIQTRSRLAVVVVHPSTVVYNYIVE